MLTATYSAGNGAMYHNWQVFQDGVLVGWVHANEDGTDFGGHVKSIGTWDDDKWARLEELCLGEIAEMELLHSF